MIALVFGLLPYAFAELVPERGTTDSRVRVVPYDPDQVLRLRGYVGYHIHFLFAEGEEFVNLAAGDSKALDVGAERNNLSIKPLAAKFATNLTIITNKRVYYVDYSASAETPNPAKLDVVYSIRFVYPQDDAKRAAAALEQQRASQRFTALDTEQQRSRNQNYWYCGASAIRPLRAYDDGVQTHLQFGARSEFPVIFVRNEDGSESLTNFNVESDEVVIHRVARRWVLRRGQLVGCIENRAFSGGGERLRTETLVPGVERRTKGGAMP
jgi:type IV secretion system protein VirB9